MRVRKGSTPARAFGLLAVVVVGSWLGPPPATAAPSVDLHELNWFVHVDLINAMAGEDLVYWEGVIDAAVTSGNGLLEGGQGPFDEPCCTRLGRAVSVTTFGMTGDGLDIIDTAADELAIGNAGGSGSNAFLVDSITYCGGSAPGTIGCAIQPSCTGNGGDDPDLWMTVTVDSFDSTTLPQVIAHERGHNSCLMHVSTAECQIMQGSVFNPGQGGCLAASECAAYQDGRTTTSSGLECSCFDNGGSILADGTICSEVVNGLCSGGLCGVHDGDAGVHLIAAAAPGTSGGGPPDDALRISALKGEWTTLAQFSPTADDVRAMAHALDSGTLYGVVPTVFDDSLVTIDPASGTIIAVVGTITNGVAEIVSMAYDPGATNSASDDRLLVFEVESGFFGDVMWIDPASPSTTNFLGTVLEGSPELFTGLAYDSGQDQLFAAKSGNPGGLYEFDLSSCPPSPCDANQLATPDLFRGDVSLAFSPISGMLYLVGSAYTGQRTFYNVLDPASGATMETLSLDVFTPAAMAAVPEPGMGLALAAGVLGVGVAARCRDRRLKSGRV